MSVILDFLRGSSGAPYPWKYISGGVIEDARRRPIVRLAERLSDSTADDVGNMAASAPELYIALSNNLFEEHWKGEIKDAPPVIKAAFLALSRASGAVR